MKRASVAGLVFAGAGLIPLLVLVIAAGGKGDLLRYLAPAALFAAFALGALFWWLLVLRSGKRGAARGAVAGALVGVVCHPVTWYLAMVAVWATGATGSLGEATMNPLQAIGGAFVFSLPSLFVIGWLTIPLGAATGAVMGRAAK